MTKPPGNSRQSIAEARRLTAWVLTLLCILVSAPTLAQERFLIQGIFDGELYKTSDDSGLLSRDGGDLSALGRLQLWSAFQISRGWQIYAMGELETDDSSGKRVTEAELEQVAFRYTNPSAAYFVEAGKLLSPLNAYSARQLSTTNPLIGQSYIYSSSYPWGLQAAGSSGRLDYRAALLDRPDINPELSPIVPDPAFRPALGFGVTPITGLRFGVSWTKGPYLNSQLNSQLPPGVSWRDFDLRIAGFDFQFSRGYFELNGQLVFSEYEVPFGYENPDYMSYYLELKYTWTPRLYGALRFQSLETAYGDSGDYLYQADDTDRLSDLEIGLGYRFNPNILLKIAYRTDHWNVNPEPYYPMSNGHSVGIQLSCFFDLGLWLSGKLSD
jgi:hypothetical protein